MKTNITCPRCQTAFTADTHQIIDVGLNPDAKRLMLSGLVNVAECPNCGALTQISMPLLYHDPDHELFLIHLPLEVDLDQNEREKLIGQLVQRAMDRLPPDQRKGYMLQPKIIINYQTLLEKVLETEGITHEMIEHQRNQAQLLAELLAIEGQEQTDLIRARNEQVDQVLFTILRASLEAAESSNTSDRLVKLTNLQAKLYKETAYGRKLENQQQALLAFSREVKKNGQLTPKLLLKHVLANKKDLEIIDALVISGQAAFNYEFFIELSQRIEKRQKSGIESEDLVSLRTHLLEVQDDLQRQSQELLSNVQKLLQEILKSEDKQASVRSNLPKIDSVFLNVLASMLTEAQRRGDKRTANDLEEIQDIIIEEIEKQAPPEIRLVNQLLSSENEEEQRQLLVENQNLVNSEFAQLVASISADAKRSGEVELAKRASRLERMIKQELQSQAGLLSNLKP